jgi:hypothetical protein
MSYLIKKAAVPVKLDAAWDSEAWQNAETVEVSLFRDRSTDHHPETQCKMLYDETGVYGLFQVKDKYVRSTQTEYNKGVCKDSCVEFFVEPAGGKGYLNFEFNCGGCLLLFHVVDATRTENGFKEFHEVPAEKIEEMEIYHTMPSVVEPEIQEETTWRLGFYAPFELFKNTTGMQDGEVSGQKWRANFYKCGDKTSHPHWASWKPLTETNFHLPECFGDIIFE